jgi:hypothetical protein
MESGVRSVESQLNAAAAEAPPAAAGAGELAATFPEALTEPPPGQVEATPPLEPPRQGSLPGFDRG